jgi:hypothetical protein
MNSTTSQSSKLIKKRCRFTAEEDHFLRTLVNFFGGKWTHISALMKNRTARQCKERWEYFLSPWNNYGEWSKEEDELLGFKIHQYGSN